MFTSLSATAGLLSVLLLFIASVSATDHIVGANKGWNPGVNYTLWANNHTFVVNDFISFRYQKTQYNVFEVNQTGYDNCTTEGAIGNWSSGKDFILLDKAKRYYFICGNGPCFNGMKVSVLVHPLALAPPPLHSNHSDTNKSNASLSLKGPSLSAAFVVGVVMMGFLGSFLL
ncbi:unnamed protein product [Cuscuta campestris]|uniref:Phytocyanin domain-containing protein n=2 Tax=Cuscuta sect. Cleistogrammica TaxID=1824901 RepID=A0A484LAU9_9ASTE|nr:hypothetical protein DM860_016798 [Cuscuta australis]VFQ73356.1 unnamed protein product [Cuscuta campestris]